MGKIDDSPPDRIVTARSKIARFTQQEDLNFLLTNRIPRAAFTRAMGRISRIRQPIVSRVSIALWRFFSDVDLSDAREDRFGSLHDAFIRRLRDGARMVDPRAEIVASPCDAIIGACGRVEAGRLHQIKGSPYTLDDLLGEDPARTPFRDGSFVTLRLTAGMYHRFHAPHDLTVERVRYIAGDTWNVNPIALKRVERLFCKNERAPISVRIDQGGHPLMLVPVAAILVASIRLPFLDATRNVRSGGARSETCHARFVKGEEMGWFEHGSTILVLAPPGFTLCEGVAEGTRIRMGQALMRVPD